MKHWIKAHFKTITQCALIVVVLIGWYYAREQSRSTESFGWIFSTQWVKPAWLNDEINPSNPDGGDDVDTTSYLQCGNGIVEWPEPCDEGIAWGYIQNNEELAGLKCSPQCTIVGTCGDGVVDTEGDWWVKEKCDPNTLGTWQEREWAWDMSPNNEVCNQGNAGDCLWGWACDAQESVESCQWVQGCTWAWQCSYEVCNENCEFDVHHYCNERCQTCREAEDCWAGWTCNGYEPGLSYCKWVDAASDAICGKYVNEVTCDHAWTKNPLLQCHWVVDEKMGICSCGAPDQTDCWMIPNDCEIENPKVVIETVGSPFVSIKKDSEEILISANACIISSNECDASDPMSATQASVWTPRRSYTKIMPKGKLSNGWYLWVLTLAKIENWVIASIWLNLSSCVFQWNSAAFKTCLEKALVTQMSVHWLGENNYAFEVAVSQNAQPSVQLRFGNKHIPTKRAWIDKKNVGISYSTNGASMYTEFDLLEWIHGGQVLTCSHAVASCGEMVQQIYGLWQNGHTSPLNNANTNFNTLAINPQWQPIIYPNGAGLYGITNNNVACKWF